MAFYRTKISSHYHVLVYFVLFHGKPAAALPPGTQVIWQNQQLVLVHDNFKIIEQAAYVLRNKVQGYYMNLYTEGALSDEQRRAVNKLRSEIDMAELNLAEFRKLLKEVVEFGNAPLAEFFEEKISNKKSVNAFFLKGEYRQRLSAALKPGRVGPPPPESYIVRHDQLHLDFNAKELIRMRLLGVFEDIELHYEDIRVEGRNNQLYAVGPKKECYNLKNYIDKMLRDNEIFIIDIYDPTVNEKISQLNKSIPSWAGAKVFTSDEVLAICQDFQNKFKLEEPVTFMSSIIESKGLFLMMYCCRNRKDEALKYVNDKLGLNDDMDEDSDSEIQPTTTKPAIETKRQPASRKEVSKPQRRSPSQSKSNESDDSNKPKFTIRKKHEEQRQIKRSNNRFEAFQAFEEQGYQIVGSKKPEVSRIKKEIVKRVIKLNQYDEKDMMSWFSKNDHIDVGNLLVQEQEGSDAVTVTLLGSQQDKENPKLVGPFDMYFNYSKIVFFKEEEAQAARNEMKVIQQKNPDYNIQYYQGFGPYKFAELLKSENLKKQIGLILKKNIREGGKNMHPFYCILFIGLHNIGNVLERRIKEAINQEARQLELAQDWVFTLKPIVSEGMSDAKLRELVEKRIGEQIKKAEHLTLNSFTFTKPQLTVKIVPAPGAGRQLMDMIKKGLKQILEIKLDGKPLEFKVSITDLYSYPEIDRNRCVFIYKPQGVFMLGIDVENEITRVKSIIQSKKVEQTIRMDVHLEPVIRDYLKALILKNDLTVDTSTKDSTFCIEIKGLVHIVKSVVVSLKQRIQQLQEETHKIELALSQEDTRVIKENNLLEAIEKQFTVKSSISEKSYEDIEIALPLGKVILTHRQVGLIIGTSQLLMVFIQQDLRKYSSDPRLPKIGGEVPFVLDSQEKVCLVKNIKNLSTTMNNIKKDRKFVILPPEDIALKEFFIQVMEQLTHYDSKEEPFNVYICAHIPSAFKELEGDIKSGKMEQPAKKAQPIWSWEDGKRNPYPQPAQDKINRAYENKETTVQLDDADLMFTDSTHTFSKTDSTLTHLLTNAVAKVAKLSPIFYKFDGKLGTMEIPASQIAKINSSPNNEVKITLVLYKIDLRTMIQTNMYTGFQRKVVKEEVAAPKLVNPLQNAKTRALFCKLSVVEFKCHVSLNNDTERRINEKVKQSLSSYRVARETMEIDSKQMTYEDLKVSCHQNGVQISIVRRNGDTLVVELKGYNSKDIEIIKHKCEIKKLSMIKAPVEVEYPATWVNGKEDIMLYQVPVRTAEYTKVLMDFKIGAIKRLLRIENKLIWKKYSEEKKALEYITGETIRQMNLFHGTRNHDPKGIYEDKEEAFNINYSGEKNYFGRGIYFAQEASYSRNYAHIDALGTTGSMLYCRVLVGTSQEMQITQKNSAIVDTNIRNETKKIKYESIHSHYDKSDIYIVYKSRRAYPEYLIEFG